MRGALKNLNHVTQEKYVNIMLPKKNMLKSWHIEKTHFSYYTEDSRIL